MFYLGWDSHPVWHHPHRAVLQTEDASIQQHIWQLPRETTRWGRHLCGSDLPQH